MKSERWRQIEELYHAALACEPGERSSVLDQADHEVRREVELLLAQEGSLLDRSAGEGDTTVTQVVAKELVGRYEIEGPLGAGGMGEVFRARDTRLGRSVAIKTSRERFSDRFEREARAISALNHPNICTLYDVGPDYLVMELVEGETLAARVKKGALSTEETLRYGTQIAEALAEAHAHNIVHRDLKPSNIMLTRHGVKVLDFGLAKVLSETGLTETHAVMGTPAYMSPEQTRGEAVDGRSDVFSLGCVLYQAATGKMPFRGTNSLAVMQAIANTHPPAPSTLREELLRELDELIARCLAKISDQRPAAAEVAAELQRLANPPARAPRVETDQPAVAVVPFRFRTASPDDEFLSIALADAVIHRLNSTGKLLVRPLAAAMRYAGKDTEWTQVARDLNTDLVIEGTIQKMGPKIRVMVQAFRAKDAQTLHSVKHDGAMEDLFGLQDHVSDAVAEMFVPRCKDSVEPAAPPTKNPLAYELYLRGVERSAFFNRPDIQSAIELFQRATQLDPVFADAWARLAQTYHIMGGHFDGDPKWFAMAETAIERTLELDPLNADALCVRAQVLWTPLRGFQNMAALRAVNAALHINPNCHAALLWRGVILYHLGLYEQSDQGAHEYLKVHPHSSHAWLMLGLNAYERGNYGAAEESIQRALLIDPRMLHANIFSPWISLALGHLAETSERIARARQLFADEPVLSAIEATLAAREGKVSRAEQLADDAVAPRKSMLHSHHAWFSAAATYALCGKADKAVVQLRRCAEHGLPNYRLFSTHPHLRSMLGYPEFMALLTDLRREHDVFRAEIGLAD
jgi:eukaryotic-like serine/threonine-protein kinase